MEILITQAVFLVLGYYVGRLIVDYTMDGEME